ncbi:hypothetical protein QQX98_002259 [Neonectria punicea]|uniref:Uncharacterized protein n=1 Tax=Neonectria punicea TaxID=979145 RepID=A0ABR1HJI8_9HYPO
MSLRSAARETSDEETTRKPRSSPRARRKIDEDATTGKHHPRKNEEKTSWKDQLKFRTFIGRRGSGSRDRARELKIVHLIDRPPPEFVQEEAAPVPREEECTESAMTWNSVPAVLAPEEQWAKPEDWDDYDRPDESEAEDMDPDDESDPFHLEDKVPSVDLTSQIRDLQIRTQRERGMSISHMSESSDESRPCSPLPFIYEDEVASMHQADNEDGNEDDSDSDTDSSPDHSPGHYNHISWNWAEPTPPAPPVALAPAPAPKPNPAMTQPPSPTEQPPPPTPPPPPPPSNQPEQRAASTLKADMVMMRRPSRPGNPWSWKLPAPDPSAPKINTVIVRRPSRMENPWTWKPSGLSPAPPRPENPKPPKPLSRRPSRLDDSWSLTPTPQSRNLPGRPSRSDEPRPRPSLPASPLGRESPLADDDRRRPSPQDALGSHPVNLNPPIHVRQDSVSDSLCRMCHVGVAEAWEVCRECEDEATSPPPQTHPKYQGGFPRPAPITTQNGFGKPSLRGHYPTASLVSNPEANEITPPISPMSRTVHTVVSIPRPAATSLSAMPTPEVLARFQYGGGPGRRTTFYSDEWPDYYLDSQAVQAKGRERADSVVSREAQGYMRRELSLEEYDGFWGSPVSPGPGWI